MLPERIALQIKGQVQGVGFRPCVYRIATELGLYGFVENNATGVCVEIQGENVALFEERLLQNLPVLARVDEIEKQKIPFNQQEDTFKILESKSGDSKTIISPDSSICEDCLVELFDKNSRYYRYPFLNCTNCGPRLTITKQLPYDRSQTAMADFRLCDGCIQEYNDPNNRRYHAQPTACKSCGPRLSVDITQVAKDVKAGKIVAIKGVGGYQLICDGRNKDAVDQLRIRKQREAKPFALMVLNVESVKQLADLSIHEEKLLTSPERPIVLLQKKSNVLHDSIAPGLSQFGIMLPHSPVHYLLFHALLKGAAESNWLDDINETILVVTSANVSGSPLIISDDEAKASLATIADRVVSYNRDIVCRADDSVMQVINGSPSFIRRARGFVPTRIKLSHDIPPTLALGAHLKNTFCLTRGDEAFVSQYIGSLNNRDTIDFFHETLEYFQKFLAVEPVCVAHDLHPDFYTSQLAQQLALPTYAVQHHHAHLASVMAEHHINQPVLGLALDGYGFGENGDSWGGELFLLDGVAFEKLGSLKPLPIIGGDVVSKEPWRMAASILYCLGLKDNIPDQFPNYENAKYLSSLLDKDINISLSSSCGRLFDAASAILNITHFSQYEGQAAMMLESLVSSHQIMKGGWQIEDSQISFIPLLKYLFNLDQVTGANTFHGTLISGLCDWIYRYSNRYDIQTIVLSGGCFLNRVLLNGLCQSLRDIGITPFIPRRLPSNDGGISLGQAWLAGFK